ncbi:MAG: hypothetical protein ACYC1Y_03350, partial [Minisyncoccota bacterium]
MHNNNTISYLTTKKALAAGVLTFVTVLGLGFGIGIMTGVIGVPSAEACCGGPVPAPTPPPPPPPEPTPILPLPVIGCMDSSATNYNANATQADNGSCTYPTPSCTLTASPASIETGSSATLSWSTSHATSASIDNGIGAITPNTSGSNTITPSSNTTYTLTTSGAGGTVHCSASITVTPPPPAPTCTLTASPTSIETGSASTLNWTTTNASSFSINQGIGSLTSVASGSKSVSPTATVTYTGTAKGAGGTVQCAATVTVTTLPPPPANGCIDVLKETFDPTGNKLTPVAQFTFTLDGGVTVKNDANGNARFIDVTPGVHKVVETPAGSTWKLLSVTPAEGSVTVQSGSTCSAVVFKNQQVVTAPPPSAPTCTLTASPTSIQTGSASTLKWTTANASSFSINQGIGSLTSLASGSKSVSPTNTITYTGTATGTGGTVQCAATVTVTTPPPPPVWTNYCTGANDPHPWQIWAYDNSTPRNYKYIGTDPSCAPPPVVNGCIDILKETFDPTGNKLTPVAQFTFTLDGGVTVKND